MTDYIRALAAATIAITPTAALGQEDTPALTALPEEQQKMQQHPYVGMWVTADGVIRQELLADGRYDEARGTRQSAYQGRYEVEGNNIFYWDDTGFTADGEFVSANELHHGGMIFFRQN
ncbi:Atu4866 domain-containing protein [Devosia riboflavina]